MGKAKQVKEETPKLIETLNGKIKFITDKKEYKYLFINRRD